MKDSCESTQGDTKERFSKVCTICSTNEAIYTCPRCAIRTCSLTCCKFHKTKFNCSGKRDVAAFVDKKDYNYFSFLSDYRFLESIDRMNDTVAREISENRRIAQNRKKIQSRILSMARSLGIQYRFSRSAFRTRAKLNLTHITGEESPYISWTLEFRLVHPNLTGCLSNPASWDESFLKPIYILLHDCKPTSLLSDIWKRKVTDLPSSEQDSLANSALTLANDSDNEKPSVTSWTLPLFERIPFFYIECFDRISKHYLKHEIFATSTTLLDVLKWDNYVVREFPVIWVSQKEFTL